MDMLFTPLLISVFCFLACMVSAAASKQGVKFFAMSIAVLMGCIGLIIMSACVAPDSIPYVLDNLPFLSERFGGPYGKIAVALICIQSLPGLASIIAWGLIVPFRERERVVRTNNPYGEAF